MIVINSDDMIKIMRNTLNELDTRLIDHGQRVAYVMWKLLEYEGTYNGNELRDLVMACFLHDLGAYKTEEIDKMVQFETWNIYEHSTYGYLFFKYLSPLKDYADIILYHHIYYRKLINKDFHYKKVALLLGLVDRIDVYFENHDDFSNLHSYFQLHRDQEFSAESIDLFYAVENKYHLLQKLYRDGQCPELTILNENPFSWKDIDQYLHMIAFSIDFRSQYMVAHTLTTTSISLALAKLCKLTDKEQENIYYGALLHDVGKVAISVDILDYPGKLTDKDMATMRSHVVYTIKILGHLMDCDVAQIAGRHHEKLDGSGYPYGLSKESLTISQRIVAIADILSALIGKRSYKESFNHEQIHLILSTMSKQGYIDEDITQITLGHLDSIIHTVHEDCAPLLDTYFAIGEEYQKLLKNFQNEE